MGSATRRETKVKSNFSDAQLNSGMFLGDPNQENEENSNLEAGVIVDGNGQRALVNRLKEQEDSNRGKATVISDPENPSKRITGPEVPAQQASIGGPNQPATGQPLTSSGVGPVAVDALGRPLTVGSVGAERNLVADPKLMPKDKDQIAESKKPDFDPSKLVK